MSNYEKYIEELLKLQRCYRIQNILSDDIISKVDLVTRPRVALTLSVALWCISKVKQSSLSYSDLVYIQRRLAQFLVNGDEASIHIIKKLFDLIPMRYGMNISLVARRCGIIEHLLTDIVKAFNIIRDVVDMITISNKISEPIKHIPSICLSDIDILPPMAANAKDYLDLIVKTLKDNIDRIPDSVHRQIVDTIHETVKESDLKPYDQAAIALITMLIAENNESGILCADPCINIVALSQKLLNDIAVLGITPYDSKFYRLYQEISLRSIVHSSLKT